jgi:hypothetical protein
MIFNYTPARDSGIYKCKIYNTVATELVLETYNYYVGVNPIPFEITAVASPDTAGTFEGTGLYDFGDNAVIVAHAAWGYNFNYWENEYGTVESIDSVLNVPVYDNRTFTAYFSPKTFTVNITIDPPDAGFVSGAGDYLYGSLARISAVPNINYAFWYWSSEEHDTLSYNQELALIVLKNYNLTAHFKFIANVDNNLANSVQIYPNPTNDILYVSGKQKIVNIQITNMAGQILKQFNPQNSNCQVNVSDLQSGLYIIKVSFENSNVTSKFIKM